MEAYCQTKAWVCVRLRAKLLEASSEPCCRAARRQLSVIQGRNEARILTSRICADSIRQRLQFAHGVCAGLCLQRSSKSAGHEHGQIGTRRGGPSSTHQLDTSIALARPLALLGLLGPHCDFAAECSRGRVRVLEAIRFGGQSRDLVVLDLEHLWLRVWGFGVGKGGLGQGHALSLCLGLLRQRIVGAGVALSPTTPSGRGWAARAVLRGRKHDGCVLLLASVAVAAKRTGRRRCKGRGDDDLDAAAMGRVRLFHARRRGWIVMCAVQAS